MPRSTRTAVDEATRRARDAGLPVSVVLPYVEAELAERPLMVTYGTTKSLDLADIDLIDGAVRVTFNLRHPFVINAMLGRHVTPDQQAAMEVVMMIVLGVTRDMDGDMNELDRMFYVGHMQQFSQRLATATDILYAYGKDGFNLLGMAEDEDSSDDFDGEEA